MKNVIPSLQALASKLNEMTLHIHAQWKELSHPSQTVTLYGKLKKWIAQKLGR